MSKRTLKIFPALATRQLRELRKKLSAFVDTPVRTDLALEYFSEKADAWIVDVKETLNIIFDDERIVTGCLRHLKSPRSQLDELQSALLTPHGVDKALYERALVLTNNLKSISKELEDLEGQLVLFSPPERPQIKEERAAESQELIDQFNAKNRRAAGAIQTAETVDPIASGSPPRSNHTTLSGNGNMDILEQLHMTVSALVDVAKEYKKEFAPLTTSLNTLLDNTSEGNRRNLNRSKVAYVAQKLEEHLRPWRPSDPPTPGVFYVQPEWARQADQLCHELLQISSRLSGMSVAEYETLLAHADSRVGAKKEDKTTRAEAENMPMLPAPYRYLDSALKKFHEDAPAERSVFVMMKFPTNEMEDWKKKCLADLYNTIKDELDRYGLVARRADQKTYSENRQLWENVCIHMWGCDYGVAILEDHVGDEFNPNVALEYGFMLSRGCKVLLLKEAKFKHIRADILSTIPAPFSISKEHVVDTHSVSNAISDWLGVDLQMAPRRKR